MQKQEGSRRAAQGCAAWLHCCGNAPPVPESRAGNAVTAKDLFLEDPSALLIISDFQALMDGTCVPSQLPPSFSTAKWKLIGKVTRALCFSKESICSVPLEFGNKHFILLIPRFLAFIRQQLFILPRVLCFFTSLWWVIITLAEIKAKHIQGCINKEHSQLCWKQSEVIISFYLAHLRSHLGYRVQFWAPSTRRMPTNCTEFSGGAGEMVRKLEHLTYRERQKTGLDREKGAKVESNFSFPLSNGYYLEE